MDEVLGPERVGNGTEEERREAEGVREGVRED